MTEKSDAQIERLEKESQESRAQISEMMELIRTLIRDKGRRQARAHRMRQPNLTREGRSLYIRRGSLPYMLQMSTWHKPHRCNKLKGSHTAMRLPRRG